MKYNNIIYGPFFPKVRISLVYSLIRLFKTEQYIFSFFSSICTVCFFLVGKSFEVIIVESRPVFVTNYIRELKQLLLRRRPHLYETIGLMIKTTAHDSPARGSRFLVHFGFDVHCTTTTWILLLDHSWKYHNTPIMPYVCHPKFCINIVFSFSWGHFNSQEKLKTMLMQNFGVTIKEHYGMLWYFWSDRFDVSWRTWTYDHKFSFLFLNLNKIPKNSTSGIVACIWHFGRVQIDAIKFERTQIHFFSDVSTRPPGDRRLLERAAVVLLYT